MTRKTKIREPEEDQRFLELVHEKTLNIYKK